MEKDRMMHKNTDEIKRQDATREAYYETNKRR